MLKSVVVTPKDVQMDTVGYVLKVFDVKQRSATEKQQLAGLGIQRNLARFGSGKRDIRICIEDCESASDNAIVGLFYMRSPAPISNG